MNIPLPRFLQQHQHHRQHATALATTIADTTLDLRDRVIVRDPSDSRTLRGIPAISANVAGAIMGSVPHSEVTVNRLDKHRKRPSGNLLTSPARQPPGWPSRDWLAPLQ